MLSLRQGCHGTCLPATRRQMDSGKKPDCPDHLPDAWMAPKGYENCLQKPLASVVTTGFMLLNEFEEI